MSSGSSAPDEPPDCFNIFLGPEPISRVRIPLWFGDESAPQPVQERLLGDADELGHLSSFKVIRFALPGFRPGHLLSFRRDSVFSASRSTPGVLPQLNR
jgi:hypothetical protein